MERIVLVGAGGHCKVIIDIIKSRNTYEIVGITEKNIGVNNLLDIPILGDDSILFDLYKKDVKNAFVSIGALYNLKVRYRIFNFLKDIGYNIPVLVHKSAIIGSNVIIGMGTCIMAGAVINSSAIIGENCIINTSSVIEHDCIIGNNCHISPKVSIGGGVKIGCNTHVGIGSSIIQRITIGNNVIVGAGAVVIDDISDNLLVVGVPAKVKNKS